MHRPRRRYLSSERATWSLIDPKACESVTRPGFCSRHQQQASKHLEEGVRKEDEQGRAEHAGRQFQCKSSSSQTFERVGTECWQLRQSGAQHSR